MSVHKALNQNNAIYKSQYCHSKKEDRFHDSVKYSASFCFYGFEMVKLCLKNEEVYLITV